MPPRALRSVNEAGEARVCVRVSVSVSVFPQPVSASLAVPSLCATSIHEPEKWRCQDPMPLRYLGFLATVGVSIPEPSPLDALGISLFAMSIVSGCKEIGEHEFKIVFLDFFVFN